MSDGKTIKFGGDIAGFKSAMKEAQQINNAYYKSILQDAAKLSTATKSQTEFLKLQAKTTEDNIKALKAEQETLIQNFNIEKKRLEAARKRGELSKEEAASQVREGSRGLNKQLAAGDKQIAGLEKVVEGLKNIKDEITLQAMKEIAADRKSVQEQIAEFKKAQAGGTDELFKKYTPEQVMKLTTQEGMLGGGGGGQQQSQSLFAAILGAEAVKGLVSRISRIGGAMAGAQSGEQFMADALKGIPLLGELIGSAIGRHQEESYNAQVGTNRLRGRMGRGGMFSASNLGYSIAETMPLAEEVVTALGTGAGYRGRTRDVMGAERAFSLDRGTLIESLKQQRMSDSGDLEKNISIVYNTMKNKGFISDTDTTQFQEILQLQNSLLSKQSEVMETTDSRAATGIIAAMRSVGGSFGDARANTRISQISGALASPGNDFQKARNMQVLSKLNPGASLFELMEMQEKGIAQQGFLGETLKQLEKETGGGEGMMLATQSRLGLGAATTRKLVEAFQKDRTMFDTFGGGKAELQEKLDLEAMGTKLTPKREQEQARISDAFVSGATKGMIQVGKEFGKNVAQMLKESGIPLGEEIGQGILNTINGKKSEANPAADAMMNPSLAGAKTIYNLLSSE